MRKRPNGFSRPESAVSALSAARRRAAWRFGAVQGSGSPFAQRSSRRQNARAATSLAVSERTSRSAVASDTP